MATLDDITLEWAEESGVTTYYKYVDLDAMLRGTMQKTIDLDALLKFVKANVFGLS